VVRVCVGNNYGVWYTLTPDNTGSYINGTWTQVASLPSGYSPLFFSSAVLPDGKWRFKVANTIARAAVAPTIGKAWELSTIRLPTPGPA